VSHGQSEKNQVAATETIEANVNPVRVVLAVLTSVAAAWIIAGSVGLLAYPLRRILACTCLLITGLSLYPFPVKSIRFVILLLLTIIISLTMLANSFPPIQVLAVALFLAFLSWTSDNVHRRILGIGSTAIAIFAVYRIALSSIPWLWLAADAMSQGLGQLTGWIVKRPLSIGPTFAGLDFLLLTTVLWLLLLALSLPPRLTRAFYGFLAILGGHLIYLIVLSFVPVVLAAVPKPALAQISLTSQQQWTWAGFFNKAVPWNVPVLACGIHLLILAAMFRWISLRKEPPQVWGLNIVSPALRRSVLILAPAIAIILPFLTMLHPERVVLEGKKIVFYEKGFLNWLKPEHGQYGRLSGGMYGMLPSFIESLGARCVISPDLSQKDLNDADALVLIFPDEPWSGGQLDRIWSFVRRGGSLLILGEHTTVDKNGKNRFNEVLEPTSIRVNFDSATFAVGGWLQSYHSIIHPMTAGVSDEQNQFGIVIGASLKTAWPARPLIMGQWGWSDSGDRGSERAMMGDGKYNPDEKLGDLVLVAEQRLGNGRVVAFGDTSSLVNGINFSSYVFTSRLFAYLAGSLADPHPLWRQILGIIICTLLVVLLSGSTLLTTLSLSMGWQDDIRPIALTILCLAGTAAFCIAVSDKVGKVLPDGRYKSLAPASSDARRSSGPNNLAYIDSSHLEAYSGESWRVDGAGGLAMTLMRNGYLTLSLPEFTAERLKKAGLLVSIAPSRQFTRQELSIVSDFVTNGGILIVTAGYDCREPSRSLLSEFGFTIGGPNPEQSEPEAMGHFKSPYLRSQDKQVYVRFHAGWPISCSDTNAEVITYGKGNLPIIILRRVGAGKVVVVGDTCFAMNMNLEWEGGEPFEGLRENADFWRWFITKLKDEPMWIPPALRSAEKNEPNSISKNSPE
jgi:hypothetical protein